MSDVKYSAEKREDGLPVEVMWRGEWYETPSEEELTHWVLFAGGADTPDGRWLEPDHPEAWPRLLGLI